MMHTSQAFTALLNADEESLTTPSFPHETARDGIELTVVMPCLNEADTVATCIHRAHAAMANAGIVGEVVVADNGSSDDSVAIARDAGARVVLVADKGYGAALMGGITAARGRFVIMGDADDSYDFGELPKFVQRLRAGAKLGEVPITLHPDGRKSHPPHLKTFRDGWRTLRFFLMCSPRRLFLLPGLMLIVLGIGGYTVAMPGMKIGGVTFDAHTLLFASLAVICGSQSMFFAAIAKTFAMTEGILPHDPRVQRFSRLVTLERGLLLGIAAGLVGGPMLLAAVNVWRIHGFGRLDYAETMRVVVPGVTLVVLGYQVILGCFFMSLLTMRRR